MEGWWCGGGWIGGMVVWGRPEWMVVEWGNEWMERIERKWKWGVAIYAPVHASVRLCIHPFIHPSIDPVIHSFLPFHYSFIIHIAILPPTYLFRHIKDCLTRTTLLICPGSAQDHRAREHCITVYNHATPPNSLYRRWKAISQCCWAHLTWPPV